MSIEQLEPLTGPLGSSEAQVLSPHVEMTNLKLQTALLMIIQQASNCPHKKLQVIKEPDPFSGRGPEKLCICILVPNLLLCL